MNSKSRHFELLRSQAWAIQTLASLPIQGGTPTTDSLFRLSERVADLLQEPTASEEALELAEDGFSTTGSLAICSGHWDERSEMLAQFAFHAWRHSLALGHWKRAFCWQERFRESFLECQVALEGCEDAAMSLLANAEAPCESYVLMSISVWLLEVNNERPSSGHALAAELLRALRTREWHALSAAERTTIVFGLRLVEAMAHRIAGDHAEATSLLGRLSADSDPLARALCERPEFESEVITCRVGSHAPGSEDLAHAFLERWRGPLWKREQLKIRMALGVRLIVKGSYKEASVILMAAVSDPWIAGEPVFWLTARSTLCDALLHSGETAMALAQLRRASRLARGLGESAVTRSYEIYCGDALRSLGRLPEAAAVWRAAVERFERFGELGWRGYTRLLLGEVLMDLGRTQEAKDALGAAVADLNSTGRRAEAVAASQLLSKLDEEERRCR